MGRSEASKTVCVPKLGLKVPAFWVIFCLLPPNLSDGWWVGRASVCLSVGGSGGLGRRDAPGHSKGGGTQEDITGNW